MDISPVCSRYLRRLLKQSCDSHIASAVDLLYAAEFNRYDLGERLHVLYPDEQGYRNVVLHLEQLICSHQHATSRNDLGALQEITTSILWWLGYEAVSPTLKQRILVVDDAIETLKLTTAILSNAGYHVESAFTGQLALVWIDDFQPDLILLDIQLPGMNGHQVYEQLQASPDTANIPVLFCSGIDVQTHHQTLGTVCAGYLLKPFKGSQLVEKVEQALMRSRVKSGSLSTEGPLNQRRDSQPVLDNFQEKISEEMIDQRCQQALNIVVSPEHHRFSPAIQPQFPSDAVHFFRATLEGRYLRVSLAFAQLCGYDSPEAMISSVTNLWQEVYTSAGYQNEWKLCLQYPNKAKTLITQIKTTQSDVVRVVEEICMVQDSYQHRLFYEGYITVA